MHLLGDAAVLAQRRPLRLIRGGIGRGGRKLSDFPPRTLLGDAEIIGALQVGPDPCARAEPAPETKCGAAGDAAASMDDLRHAIEWDDDLSRKLGRRDAKLGPLVNEDFCGVDTAQTPLVG